MQGIGKGATFVIKLFLVIISIVRLISFTFPSDYRNCDFSFANMCSWRFLYDSEFAIVDGYLLIRFMIEDKSRFAYMMPVGDGDLAGAVRLLENVNEVMISLSSNLIGLNGISINFLVLFYKLQI